MTLERFILSVQTSIAMLIATIGLLIALLATSTLFPQMLQKGSIDLLLCRPIPRWRVISARFAGGMAIMAFNAVYLMVGVWLVLGWKSGVWNAGFPRSAALAIFAFMVLFSALMMATVVSESAPVGLLVTYTLLMFSPVLAAHEQITPVFSKELYRQIFRSFYWVLPKIAETIGGMRRLIMNRPLELEWVVGTSLAFAIACYLVTVVYFTRKDY